MKRLICLTGRYVMWAAHAVYITAFLLIIAMRCYNHALEQDFPWARALKNAHQDFSRFMRDREDLGSARAWKAFKLHRLLQNDDLPAEKRMELARKLRELSSMPNTK